jgi:hypothetical protein
MIDAYELEFFAGDDGTSPPTKTITWAPADPFPPGPTRALLLL